MERGLHEGTTHDPLHGGSFGVIAAAHELKSPVALIRQLALSAELADDAALQRDMLQRIVLTSERSLRLTENLTRAHTLTAELFATEPVNAQQLCEEVAHELMPLYQAYGRELIVQKRRRMPPVIANRDLLRRILLGFGDNALQYTSGQQAVFRLRQVGSHVQVGLRDFGPVVAGEPNIQQRIYRPESSGIGLSIAEKFAHAMHGRLGVTRHRDGMTYYVQMLPSEQLRLL